MGVYTSNGVEVRVEDMVDISSEYKEEIKYIKKLNKLYTKMTGIRVPKHKIKIVDLGDEVSALLIENIATGRGSKDTVVVYNSNYLREQIQGDILCVTVWHEITHLIDIVKYNKIKGYEGKGYEFTVWTEYNARYMSMRLFMQYKCGTKEMFTGGLKYKQLEGIDKITRDRLRKTYELYNEGRLDEMIKKLRLVYESTQYIGQYSLFEELDSDYFKDFKRFIDLGDYNLDIAQVEEVYNRLKILKHMTDIFNTDEYKRLRLEIMKLFQQLKGGN